MNLVAENTNSFVILSREGSSELRAQRHLYGVFGHPSDFNEMMDVAAEMLEFSDCIVHVQNPNAAPSAEDASVWTNELSLIVFVVSERFLEEVGFARCLMLPEAMKKRVRILPVKSADSGRLGEEFSRICGKIHLLDRGTQTFKDDLKTYFDSVLEPYRMIDLSEEQKRIRADLFRCKAFISYRKKDIDQLLRLLDFIREIPELRDMAVFFDSALVPGEDFNQRLKNEISGSDIIIFVVTPHLMEDGNYVIREEYPQAVAEGKILIPVFMDDTDASSVRSVFSAFEEVLDFDDKDALVEKLISVRSMFGDIPSMTPEYKHLLAIAYETGDGTERNYILSNLLLREAASKGFPASVARLTIQHLEGLVNDEYEGETEDLLLSAMRTFNRLVLSIPPSFDSGANGASLARFSDELYEILSKKEGYHHSAILQTIICLERANFYVREAGYPLYKNSYYAKPLVRFAELYLFEGDLEEAEAYLDNAEKDLKTQLSFYGRNVYLMEQVCKAHICKGHLLVRYLLRGDKRDHDTVVEAHKVYAMAMILSLNLCRMLGTPLPEIIVNDECIIARIMQKSGMHDDLEEVLDCLNMTFFDTGFSKVHFDEDYLDVRFAKDDVFCLNIGRGSLGEWKDSLDKYTEWYVMDRSEEELQGMFSFRGFIPEGPLGDICGNYMASAYKCFHCGTRLYKVIFPEGNDPELYLGEQKEALISPSRVFACPRCGRFFATPKGIRLLEGPVFQASPFIERGNTAGKKISREWWDYFDAIGDLRAVRKE
ncbi:toll/interleukin-1 receptor domain-containing protein [Butyrivibrio sp. AE2032]|uniref:toll/interleukin-1 receptor domain-containing protein n=1 Tax=Butyrivibrio sp. AE2032 TaxID=1458463 RepID=UPI0005583A3E|nr:toll/interleukin-1 receptor domain-containing protein [Butyrivibrio sp. AE2032]